MTNQDLYNSIPALILIAIFVFSFIGAFHKIKSLERKKWFKYFASFAPPIVGALLGVLVPFLFPDNLPLSIRMLLGAIGGFNAALIIGFFRRYIKIASKNEDKGIKSVFEAANSMIEAPIDIATGKTLSPFEKGTKTDN